MSGIGFSIEPGSKPPPAISGLYIRHWRPALRAAGVEHRGVYACRHTFAAWSIAAGVQLFCLSRIMGTSVTQIDATYGHLVPESEEYLRGLLDAYDVRDDESTNDAQQRIR